MYDPIFVNVFGCLIPLCIYRFDAGLLLLQGVESQLASLGAQKKKQERAVMLLKREAKKCEDLQEGLGQLKRQKVCVGVGVILWESECEREVVETPGAFVSVFFSYTVLLYRDAIGCRLWPRRW